ncbi:helix-turn-helix domain-containing protein [Stecheria sp. CLA-KB-P133]|uniref:Helix-turn-helix domain-containing protein n=1 Tax=Grylomicrobium aquisgranensis TaxID=2926318 RepID=A0AB35U5P5_9FIRM|nr:helix-turn-helix domain-containing protein [Stecheria sp. CLA-KB-P133]
MTTESASLLLFDELGKGSGIQEVLTLASKEIFHNPILLTNAAFRTIAITDDEFDDLVWNEAKKNGHFSASTIHAYKDDRSSHKLFAQKKSFIYSSGLASRIPRILSPILYGSDIAGYTIIFQTEKKLDENDLHLVECLNNALRILMIGGHQSPDLNLSVSEYEYKMILDGKATQDELEEYKSRSKNPYTVISASLPSDRKGKQYASYLIETLRTIPGSIVFPYRAGIFLLLNYTDCKVLNKYLAEIEQAFTRYHLRGGISNSFSSLSTMKEYFEQTLAVRKTGQIIHPGKSLYRFSEYLPYEIIDLAGPQWCESAISDQYRQLKEYDMLHATDFVKTIQTLLECGYNITRTAKSMNVHRNTVNYRLEMLNEKFGISIQDTSLLESIRFSYMMDTWYNRLQHER